VSTQSEKAARFRALHHSGQPLVLVNAWDAASARIVESLGFPAVATTSAGVAFLEGYADGERIGRDAMLAGVARITRVVSVPVTADLESGYGLSVEDAIATARGAIAAGAVGMNFEDGSNDGAGLIDADLQAERIRAIRRVADETGVPLVINARTDGFLKEVGAESERMEEALRRGTLYRAAGADCIFVPGVSERGAIETLASNLGAPLNVLANAKTPSIAELQRIGVARVSLGSGPYGIAYGAFRNAALEARDRGTFASAAGRISHADLNALFEESP
jgi:2-methylisocitrate lyase-like PEP mutase family enzyme